jgi:hypothetical protein
MIKMTTTEDAIAVLLTERELFAQFLKENISDLAWNGEETVREAITDPGEFGLSGPIAGFVLSELLQADCPSNEFWEQVDALENVHLKFKCAYEHYEQYRLNRAVRLGPGEAHLRGHDDGLRYLKTPLVAGQ